METEQIAPAVKPPFKITPVVLHVLLALSDGETHGYGIMREITERTRGALKVGPGSLYFPLNRLLEAGMIEESSDRPDPELDDARRKYYRLKDFGLAVLESELALMSEIVEAARAKRVLRGPSPA